MPPASSETSKPAPTPRIAALPPAPAPAEVAKPTAARAIAARVVSYSVQLGVFKSAEKATKLFASITDPKATLEPGPKLTWRVFLGPFADKAAALLKERELRAHGYPTHISEARE